MSPIVSTFDIGRPPEEVYAYATDPTRFAEWQRDVERVDLLDGGPPGMGTRFITVRRIGPVARRTTQVITRADPPHGWAARGVAGPFRPNASIAIEPLDGGARSRVTVTLDFEGHGIGRLLPLDAIRRMAARGAPMSYRNLTEILERGALA